jgi:hypothetical protein
MALRGAFVAVLRDAIGKVFDVASLDALDPPLS